MEREIPAAEFQELIGVTKVALADLAKRDICRARQEARQLHGREHSAAVAHRHDQH
jgi:hypothetical protein